MLEMKIYFIRWLTMFHSLTMVNPSWSRDKCDDGRPWSNHDQPWSTMAMVRWSDCRKGSALPVSASNFVSVSVSSTYLWYNKSSGYLSPDEIEAGTYTIRSFFFNQKYQQKLSHRKAHALPRINLMNKPGAL